jgi:hypothetical protein
LEGGLQQKEVIARRKDDQSSDYHPKRDKEFRQQFHAVFPWLVVLIRSLDIKAPPLLPPDFFILTRVRLKIAA